MGTVIVIIERLNSNLWYPGSSISYHAYRCQVYDTQTLSEAIGLLGCRCNGSNGSMSIKGPHPKFNV